MLDMLVNAAVNWIQKNPDHMACMAQKAFSSIKSSFQGTSLFSEKVTLSCPQCGRQYVFDEHVYTTQVKGKRIPCECGVQFKCT